MLLFFYQFNFEAFQSYFYAHSYSQLYAYPIILTFDNFISFSQMKFLITYDTLMIPFIMNLLINIFLMLVGENEFYLLCVFISTFQLHQIIYLFFDVESMIAENLAFMPPFIFYIFISHLIFLQVKVVSLGWDYIVLFIRVLLA